MGFEQRVIKVTEDGRTNVTVLRCFIDSDNGLAFIDWELNGELYYIKVPAVDRRKGIATKLWNMAKDYANQHGLIEPTHSAYRSDEGDAWAKSLSNDLPTRIFI